MKPVFKNFLRLPVLARVSLAVLLSCAATSAPAQGETLEPQGSLPNWFSSEAVALSADGQMMAGNAINSLWQYRAYHFDKASGALTELTLGGDYSFVKSISANGLGVIGQSKNTAGDGHAFYWNSIDGMTQLSLGGDGGNALAVSANGLAVAGQSKNSAGHGQAFHWSKATGITEISLGGTGGYADHISGNGLAVAGHIQNALGEGHAFHWNRIDGITVLTLGGGIGGFATGISSDGLDVAGKSEDAQHESHAFHWSKATGITKITLGGTGGEATGISDNGTAVIGKSANIHGQTQAFHWRKGGALTELSLGGTSGEASFVSADGRVVAGQSATAAGETHAFRWQEGGTATALTLGGTQGKVTGMSQTGAAILGESEDALGSMHTFLWTSIDNIRSIDQIIADAMIDTSGWSLVQGGEVLSANGLVIAGKGTFNGQTMPYLLTGSALVTPEDIARSLSSLPVAQQQATASVGDSMQQSLSVARNAMQVYFAGAPATASPAAASLQDIAPAAGTPFRKAVYATGSFGIGHDNNNDNHAGTGTTGALFQLSDETSVGAGLLGSYGRQETYLGGNSRSTAAGLTVMAAHEAASGLRLYASTAVSAVGVSARRHYMNGGAVDASSSDTDGVAYGVAVKGGYEIPLRATVQVMPYAEVDVAHVRLDGYTERGGGLPASIGAQSTTSTVSRLGIEAGHDITPALHLRGRAAWGHRYGDDGSLIATTTLGTQSLSAEGGNRNWGEGGISLNYRLSGDAFLVTDISGRAGRTGEPALNAMAGFVWNWN